MKKLFILSLLIFITYIAPAQVQRVVTNSPKPDSAKGTMPATDNKRLERKKMMRDLDLTKEQRSKLKEIHDAGQAKKEAIEGDDKLSDTEKQNRLRELRKEQSQNTMKILNPEQQQKMKAARIQMRKGQKDNVN